MKADPRLFRFDHTAVATALLSGFVFDGRFVIPAGAALMLAAAAFPGMAPTHRLFTGAVAPRLRPVGSVDDTGPWRRAALYSAAGLAGATGLLAVGANGVAWLVALVVAGVGALTGVGGWCPGCGPGGRPRR